MPNYFDEDMEWLNNWGNQKRTPKKTKVSSKPKSTAPASAHTSMADFRQMDEDSNKAYAIAHAKSKPAKKSNQSLASKIEESKPWQTIIGDYSVGEMLDAITMANPALTTAAGIKGLGGAAKAANKATESAAAKALKSLATKTPAPVKKAVGIGAAATGYEAVKGATDPDYVNPITKQKTLPAQTGASLRAGTGDVLKNLGSVAEWKGKDDLGESLKKTGENISKGYETEQVPFTWRSLFDPDWYANNVARSVPSTATLIPLMAAGYKLGGAGAAKSGIKALSGPMGKTIIGSLTGTALSRPMESAMEAGNTYEDALSKGMSREEADEAAQQVFNANLKLAGLDAAQLTAAFAPAPAKLAAKVGKAGMVAGKLGLEAGTEALEEGYQQAVQQQAAGDDKRGILEQVRNPNQEMQESMAIGGIFGLGMGGAGVVNDMVKNIKSRTIENLPDAVMPEVEAKVKEHVANGMTPSDALDNVLDEMAEVPEVAQAISNITQEEAQKALTTVSQQSAQGNANINATPETNTEPAEVTVYSVKTGEPLKIVDGSNPEFMVVENTQGQRIAVTPDEVTNEVPQNIQAEKQVVTEPQAEQATPVKELQVPQDTTIVPEQKEGLERKIEPQKEPWQMTKQEYLASQGIDLKAMEDDTARRIANQDHAALVKQALAEGQQVPEQVLKQYPKLNPARNNEIQAKKIKTQIAKSEETIKNYERDLTNIEPGRDRDLSLIGLQEERDKLKRLQQLLEQRVVPQQLKQETPLNEKRDIPEVNKGDTVYDQEGNALKVVNPGNAKTMRVEGEDGKQKVVKKGEVREEKPITQPAEKQVIKGSFTTAKTERGTKIDAHYAVVDADDLVASHTTGFMENKNYPQELQPRDRERAASKVQITRIAQNIEPAFLGESPKASDGAPIVGQDMVVESGNGRVIALQTAYENNETNDSADRYRQYLKDNAKTFGLDLKAIDNINKPVLVRVRTSDVDRAQFAKEANEQSVAAMSASEQAMSDAAKLTQELLNRFYPGESGEILAPSNRYFIQDFVSTVIGPAEQARYVTSDGSISQEGVNRIRNAIFAKAYGDVSVIEKLAESTDNNIKNITNAMLMAAPRFAEIKAASEAGNLHDLDITPEIGEAARRMSMLREQGISFDDYIYEQSNGMFGSDLEPLVKDILEAFNQFKRSSKKVFGVLKAYTDGVIALGDPKQGALFGENEVPERSDILNAAINLVEGGESDNGQTSLFESERGSGKEDGKANTEETERGPAKGAKVSEPEKGFVNNRQIDILRENNISYNADLLLREGEKNDAGRKRLKASIEQLTLFESMQLSNPRGTLDRSGGIKTLALGITREAVRTGRIDLRGKKAATPKQIATLAQVFRNPSYETFRIFYMKGNTIVAHEATTTRLPGSCALFSKDNKRSVYEMKQRMQRLGADGYYLLHNHPSGHSNLSREDIGATQFFASRVPGFKGHVVINSNEYSYYHPAHRIVDNSGHVKDVAEVLTTKKVDFSKGKPDALHVPAVEHVLLGQKINSDGSLAQMSKALQMSKDMAVLIYTDSPGYVRAVQEVPIGLFNHPEKAADYIRGRSREFGGRKAFVTSNIQDNSFDNIRELVKQGVLQDAILIKDNGYQTVYSEGIAREASQNSEGKWMGKKIPRYSTRVQEKDSDFKREQAEKAPVFFSQLQRTIQEKMPNRAMPMQVIAIIKGGKVKEEEIRWSGIMDWLRTHEGKVSKDEVLEYLRANDVQVEEVTKGGDPYSLNGVNNSSRFRIDNDIDTWSSKEVIESANESAEFNGEDEIIDIVDAIEYLRRNGTDIQVVRQSNTQYETYQLPGGENYREVLFTLPDTRTKRAVTFQEYLEKNKQYIQNYEKHIGSNGKISENSIRSNDPDEYKFLKNSYEQELKQSKEWTSKTEGSIYQSGHWDEPNVLAHVRFNDRTGANGEKILHIEEVQSDWHQEGRRKGYKGKVPAELQKRFDEAREKMNKEQTKYYGLREELGPNGPINEQKQIMLEAERAFEKIRDQEMSAYIFGVPDAPFKTTWPEFVMKRMIRYAAENGYDRISWTTGAQQAERYDLSKQVKFIGWQKYGDGKYHVTIKDPELNLIYNEREKTINDIEELAGKEIAKKIQSSAENSGVIEGDNLRIGGSGMSGFYDKMIPSWLNKYAKKWGARVEESKINTPDNKRYEVSEDDGGFGIYDNQEGEWLQGWLFDTVEEAQRAINSELASEATVHSIPITESMRQSVLYDGQPKFKKAPGAIQTRLDEASQLFGWKKNWAPNAMKSERFQAANELSKALTGNEIITYTTNESEHGFSLGGRVFLNARSRQPILYVTSHEITHTMEVNSPEHYDKLMDIVIEHVGDNSGIIRHYISHKYEKYEIPDELTADVLAECMVQPSFWQRVRDKAPELLKPILDVIDRILAIAKKQTSVPQKYQMMQYMKDVETMRDRLAAVYKDYLQSIGETPAGISREAAAKTKGERKGAPDLTDTPEFKQWFGDSKVVDESGKPLVVYHGTNKDFNVFDANMGGSSSSGGAGTSYGFFFAEDRAHADYWAENATNNQGGKPKTMKVYLSVKNPLVVKKDDLELYNHNIENAIEKAWENGNDGVKFEGLADDETMEPLNFWLVFEPEQIKSATANRGTFDPNNPDIRYKHGSKFELQDPDIEARMEAACGVPQETMRQKITEMWDEIKRRTTREYEYLPRTGRFSELRKSLLQLRKAKGIAGDKTLRILNDITKPLDEYEYSLFTKKVIMDDLAHEAEEGHLLPFGFTPESLEKEKALADEAVKQNANVSDAVQKRKQEWTKIKDTYVSACQAIGFKVEDRLKKEDYYRHQVLEHALTKGVTGSGKKLRTPTGRGFLKQREGSSFDINTDYLQAEYEVMAQMLYDTAIVDTIKVVKKHYDVVNQLKRQAVQTNNEKMLDYFAGMIEKFNLDETDPGKMYRQLLNKKQAIAMGDLEKLAANGELPVDDAGRFEPVIQHLADSYLSKKMGNEGVSISLDSKLDGKEYRKEFFAYLNWLTKGEEGQAKIIALTVYKGMAEKQRKIKNTLGRDYVTWSDLVPEGYSIWQPREGNMFYMADSIPERIAEALYSGILEEAGITGDMLKKVMIMGQKYPEMVLPDEVVLTLDNLYKNATQEGPVAKFYHTAMRAWKQWQLLFAKRYFKYNVRNMTGDLDAVIAGSPGAIKKIPQAWKELKQAFFTKDRTMTPELEEWFNRGGFETLLQCQEINDVNRNRMFKHLMDSKLKRFPAERLVNAPKDAWLKYWDFTRTTTDFREALCRYAAYLDYLEQMEDKQGGRPKNFGASNRGEIMALYDVRDRAFKLSNELLGAYDEVSHTGVWLSDNLLPFWRWNEVNFTRYCRLFKNAYQDGKLMAAVGRKVATFPIRSAFIAMQCGKLLLKASALTAMIVLWNKLFFGDADDDLPDDVKQRLHITFGRDKDGNVIYFSRLGALQDFMDWFGVDTPYYTAQNLLSGKRNWKETLTEMVKSPLNKVATALGPQFTLPLGLGLQIKLFPDATKPGRVRDRTEFLFDSFGLKAEYREITGKPTPGYGKSVKDIFAYQSNPQETAYYATKDEKARFMKKIHKYSEGWRESEKGEVLYNVKLALRYKDKEAAIRYLQEYIALGGTAQGLQQSLRSMDPLYGLTNEEKIAFIKQLDAEGREDLVKAYGYYNSIINPSKSEKD